jgi:transmembrane sensor
MINKSFEDLCKGYLQNQLSPEELAHFVQLIQQQEYQEKLQATIEQLLNGPLRTDQPEHTTGDALFQKIIDNAAGAAMPQEGKLVHLDQKTKPFTWIKIAAVLTLVLTTVAYFLFNDSNRSNKTAKVPTRQQPENDVLPGGDKAILKLADGSVIVLDNAQNGHLTQQGNTTIKKQNGELVYDASRSSNTGNAPPAYNTISTPRGGQYRIILADGSKVWLNAASSLRFPTAFTGKERKIEITGEAYVEVAPFLLGSGQKMPFRVNINNKAEIEVLGTQFNIMAYDDEAMLKTTLVEGSLKFVTGSNMKLLQPGQQSQLTKDGQVKVLKDIDVEKVTAWKNGSFRFEEEDFDIIARQLSRWYNVEVVYDKKPKDLFYAEISRDLKLSDALKALELTGRIRFRIEENKVIVIDP